MTNRDYDIPLATRTISIRSPRAVLLLNPTLPLVLAAFGVSIVFTIWPEALNHSPIGFERRGIIHHVWHYTLFVGSALALVGMFGTFTRRLEVELFGTILLAGALTLNLIANVNEAFLPVDVVPSGLGMAMRAGVIFVFVLRVYVLVARPHVDAPVLEERQ